MQRRPNATGVVRRDTKVTVASVFPYPRPRRRWLLSLCAVAFATATVLAPFDSLALAQGRQGGQGRQQPDPATAGPKIGATVPAFSGVDQFGATQTLASVMGPQGAMLVFYRSADW